MLAARARLPFTKRVRYHDSGRDSRYLHGPLPPSVRRLVGEVRSVSPVPVAVGFGISRPSHVASLAAAGADGAVVASVLVDALGPEGRPAERWHALLVDHARHPPIEQRCPA